MKSLAKFSAVCGALLFVTASGAEEPALDARLACAPAARPGRVFCQLDLVAKNGRVAWGDALVTEAPSFVRPLRSRVQARSAENGAAMLVAKLALVATEAGSGSLAISARAVVCRAVVEREVCLPELVHLTTQVAVGSAAAVEN
ncbi:MAG TPA: hypothetical protein VGM29_10540 [Polyangiaceae bacterium]|jgi:hypothetical protein